MESLCTNDVIFMDFRLPSFALVGLVEVQYRRGSPYGRYVCRLLSPGNYLLQ